MAWKDALCWCTFFHIFSFINFHSKITTDHQSLGKVLDQYLTKITIMFLKRDGMKEECMLRWCIPTSYQNPFFSFFFIINFLSQIIKVWNFIFGPISHLLWCTNYSQKTFSLNFYKIMYLLVKVRTAALLFLGNLFSAFFLNCHIWGKIQHNSRNQRLKRPLDKLRGKGAVPMHNPSRPLQYPSRPL